MLTADQQQCVLTAIDNLSEEQLAFMYANRNNSSEIARIGRLTGGSCL
jgi:hypothetical protein